MLDRSAHDLAGLLAELTDLFAERAAKNGIRLRTQAPSEAVTAEVDSDRLLQVLSNLVGNAVRFTPRGGEICVGVERDEDVLCFWVKDTGPGIEPGELKFLFERHWQSNRARGDGLGLGLFIARNIVALHGGRIWVESTPGQGSTFFFTVPCLEPRTAPAALPATWH